MPTCERESFPVTLSTQKGPSPLVLSINCWKVCLRRKREEEGSGGRFWKMAFKTDFGILYYEDRRPLYCTTESRRTATFGLFLGLLEDRCECGRCARGDSSGDRLCDNVLLCLIAVLNRNTLVPSATRSFSLTADISHAPHPCIQCDFGGGNGRVCLERVARGSMKLGCYGGRWTPRCWTTRRLPRWAKWSFAYAACSQW
jgi:hypothetical protein